MKYDMNYSFKGIFDTSYNHEAFESLLEFYMLQNKEILLREFKYIKYCEENFKNMGYSERVEIKEKYPEVYENLMNEMREKENL